jgi:hypothetical protein
MLACGTARAQTIDGNEPFISSGAGNSRLFTGTTPLRLWYQTQGYGQDAAFTSIGGRWAADLSDAIGFVDGNFRIDNNSKGGGNIGGGFRWFQDGLLLGDPRIWGVSGWYDGQESSINKYFNQLGVSFESLGQYIDLRLNANIPLDERKMSDTTTMTNQLAFTGNSLGIATLTPTDVALRVVDFEVAARVFDLNLWAYGGGYEMDGQGVSAMGRKAGMRGYVTNDLVLSVGVTDDDVFGTNTVVQAIWTPGRTSAGPSWWTHELPDRMREQVYRNQYVALQRTETEGTKTLTNTNGTALRIVHVDSSAAAGGNGTAEHPLNSLTAVNSNSQTGDIILVHANSSFADQTATLQDQQRFLGEGGGITHTVATAQMGTVTLPETFAGALNATRPIIDNTGSPIDAVSLAATTVNQTGFTPIEVSNFTIMGGARGIASGASGVGGANINNIAISNTIGVGIQLAAMTEQVSGSSQQLRFQPTINTVSFTNTGGGDILLDSNPTNQATGFTTTEAIAVSNVTSTGTSGISIDLQNTRRTATLSNISYDGSTTGIGGLRVQNGLAAANVIVNGTNTFAGGTTANADTQGFAIDLESTASTQTVTGTTITNTGGDSIIVDGSSASMAFTGHIDKTTGPADGSAVSVLGGHTGTLTFTELSSGQGVINQTVGDGLQFANADGTYTFNDKVILNGGDAGIDVTAGSSGTFNFADSGNAITSPTGVAVNIDASNAIFTYSGAIKSDNADAVNISNNTGGSATFNSTIDSMHGITVNANSGGSYLFAQQVTLTGTDNGVEITNNTGGNTQFSNIDITKTGTGTGFVATSASTGHTVTVTGTTNTISTKTGVALNLNTIAAGTNGINFQSVSSDGAANGIMINNVTGGPVNIGTAGALAGTSGTIDNSTGAGVTINNAANVSINGLTVNNTGGTGDGIAITHTNAAQSVVRVNNATISNTGGAGIDFNRSASGLSRFTLTGSTISSTGDQGVALTAGGSNTVDITVTGNNITNTSSDSALALNATGGAKTVNILLDSNTFTNNSTSATVALDNNSSGTINTNVTANSMSNADATTGRAFAQTNSAGSTRLNLNGNSLSNASATNEISLTQSGGTFTVVDLPTLSARNGAAGVDTMGTVTTEAGPVPQPTP